METVEVVIKIPKEKYKLLTEMGDCVLNHNERAIKHGIVLPKGHGRLIDADAINIHDISPAYGMEVYGVTQDDIEYEPTVIEANKEVSDDR